MRRFFSVIRQRKGIYFLQDLNNQHALAGTTKDESVSRWFQRDEILYMHFHMLCFGILHLTALFAVTMLYVVWCRRFPQRYRELLGDTHSDSVIISPILTYGMAFNVFLVLGYVYIDWMRINVQLLLPYAAAVYGLLWLWTIVTAIRLQALAHFFYGRPDFLVDD